MQQQLPKGGQRVGEPKTPSTSGVFKYLCLFRGNKRGRKSSTHQGSYFSPTGSLCVLFVSHYLTTLFVGKLCPKSDIRGPPSVYIHDANGPPHTIIWHALWLPAIFSPVALRESKVPCGKCPVARPCGSQNKPCG